MELTVSLMDTALALSEKDRAELAYQLLLSLKDAEPDAHIEQAWAEEIRGRIKEFRQDQSIAQDFGEAMMEVRTSLKHCAENSRHDDIDFATSQSGSS